MYAVVRTGSKQYRVEPGTIIEVESIEGEKGSSIELADVLLVDDGSGVKIGTPALKGAVVVAQIVEHKRAAKVIIYKKLKRHGRRLKKGHRQELTRLKVQEIRVA